LIGYWRDSASGISSRSAPVAAGDSVLAPSSPPPPVSDWSRARSQTSTRGERVSSDLIVLEAQGRGYGHGVGMSQWGAHGLASQGAGFRDILRHYYRGATIRPYQPADDPAVAFSTPSEPALKG